MDVVAHLYPYLPYVAAAVVAAAIVVVIFLALTLQKARKREPVTLVLQESSPASAQTAASPAETPHENNLRSRLAQARAFRRSILQAMKFLRENTAGRDYRYQIPWFLLVGEPGAGKTTVVESAGLRSSLLERAEDFGIHQGLEWRFFNQGVVLDIYGEYIGGTEDVEKTKWEILLRQLRNLRARRPLDGLVVMLPCQDFLAPQANDTQALEAKAARLSACLWRAQKILGFSFPVYVIVTRCDEIFGFRGFCNQIPLRNRQDVFGWSSPYSLVTSFKPSWVNEAFDSMGQDLGHLQSEIFAERGTLPDADEVFMFPGEFEALRTPLGIFLDRMFKETAYHEAFYFRGLYFCGDPSREETSAPAPVQSSEQPLDPFAASAPVSPSASSASPSSSPPHRPIFLMRLFEEKIFPESALARPLPGLVRSKSRLEWGSQLAALLLALILSWGVTNRYLHMRRMWYLLGPTLHGISHEMRPGAAPVRSGQSVCDLTQSMAELNTNVFSSWFIPASLFSPLNDRVKRAMEPAYRLEVLDTLRRLLENRADQVMAMPTPQGSQASTLNTTGAPQPVANYSPESTPEFQALLTFTHELSDLQTNLQRYEALRGKGTGGVEQLNGLVNYLGLNCTLPPNYSENPYFQNVIMEVSGDPFNGGHVKGAHDKLEALLQSYFDAWLENNPLLVNLKVLQSQIEGLENGPTPTTQDLQNLDARITLVKQLLSRPDFSWVAAPKLDPSSPFYQAAMDAARRTRFFHPSMQNAIRSAAENDFQNLRWQLQTAQTDLTGNLLEPQGTGFQLSPGVTTLQLDVENLLNLPFMSAATTASSIAPLPTGQLMWDPGPLDEALSRYDDYERYEEEGLRSSNHSLQAIFRQIARKGLEANMMGLIARAQSFAPLSEVGTSARRADLVELKNFAAAEAPLAQILDAFQKLGFYSSYSTLRELTVHQAASLLSALEKDLQATQPYVEKDGNFFWWHGEPNPSLEAFDARNAAQLDAYLTYERQRIGELAQQAKPLILFLATRTSTLTPAERQSLDQWRQIVAALNAYNRKIPGNPVAQLEDFIRTDMNKYAPAQDCQGVRSQKSEAAASDFFLERRDALRRGIEAQCHYLANWMAYRDYSSLAKLFNRTLAGRFPFARQAPLEPSNEADPEAIRAFYQQFDAHQSLLRLILSHTSHFGPTRKPTLEFLDRMTNLRPLFASLFLGEPQPPVMALDFVPAFRVDRQEERGGNQIIGWTLRVGSESFQAHEPVRTGRWEVGMPVSLSLRWATDSPALPIAQKRQLHLQVEGRVATFQYTDPWSLFSLLYSHHAPPTDFPALVDPHPFTLAFDVATVERAVAGSKGSIPVPKETRVFIRISIMPPGKKQPLLLPPFPTKAPTLIWENP